MHVIKKSARESLLLEHGVDRSGFGNRELCYTTQLIVRAFVSQQQSTDDVIYQVAHKAAASVCEIYHSQHRIAIITTNDRKTDHSDNMST